jgi:hypothetical protein
LVLRELLKLGSRLLGLLFVESTTKRDDTTQESQKDIRIHGTLVSLINDDGTVSIQ